MFAPRGWLKRPVPRMIYRTIENSGLFDPAWYRSTNMAFHEKLMDPLWHYLDVGGKRGLNPSVFFDTDYYLQANPDVKELGLNPLFHYVKYGVGEQRHPLQTGLQALHSQFGPAAPLTLLSVPATTTARLTLVIDDCTPRDSHLPYWSLIAVGATLARESDARLRLVDRRTIQSFLPVGEMLQGVGITLPHGWELLRVALSPRYQEITSQPGEIFVATSFASHLALSPLPTAQRRYLLSDDESRLYGDTQHGNQAHIATSEDGVSRVHLGVNLEAASSRTQESGAQWIVTSTPHKNSPAQQGSLVTIGVDVDRLATGQMVAATISCLEYAIKHGVIDPHKHRVIFTGESPRPIALLATLVPEHLVCENLDDLEALANSLDVMITLARPHSLGISELSVLATGGQVVSRYDGDTPECLHRVAALTPAGISEQLALALQASEKKPVSALHLSHSVRVQP